MPAFASDEQSPNSHRLLDHDFKCLLHSSYENLDFTKLTDKVDKNYMGE